MFGIILSAAGASAMAAPLQFDLNCVGTRYINVGELKTPDGQFAEKFHVDLERGLWCSGNCEQTSQIASISPEHLELSTIASNLREISISRVDGTIVDARPGGTVNYETTIFTLEGTCKVEPLTTSPKAVF